MLEDAVINLDHGCDGLCLDDRNYELEGRELTLGNIVCKICHILVNQILEASDSATPRERSEPLKDYLRRIDNCSLSHE